MKIKFIPTGQEIDVNPNKSLLQLCVENNIEIKSICKGVPSCAECRVNIASGEHNILPPSKAELSLIGTNYFIDSRRLSCQVRCFGEVTVDLTDQLARAENQTKKTRGFRAQKGPQVETHAKQGTLVLEEADKPQAPQEPRPPQQPRPQNQNRNQQQGQQKPQQQGQKQNPNQNRNNQNQNKNKQNPNQNKGGQPRPQQQGPKPQQQGQKQNPNQNRNNPNQNKNQQSKAPQQQGQPQAKSEQDQSQKKPE